jgi:uncharacterized damage-inducible protein DinB
MNRELFDAAPLAGCQRDLGLLAAVLQDGTREWRWELEGVTEDAIVWQPFPNGHSIGAMMFHIIEAEVYWVEMICKEMPANEALMKEIMSAEIKQDEIQWPTPPKKPISYYFELHDQVRARMLKHIETLQDPAAVKTRKNDDVTVRWVLGHIIQHEAYHGGQIVLLNEIYKRRALGSGL